MKWILGLYDAMRERRMLCLLSCLLATALLVVLVLRLSFKEDITDFLPLDEQNQEQLQLFQEISGADRIVAVFQFRDSTQADPDVMVEAIERFVSTLEERDTSHIIQNIVAQTDLSQADEMSAFVYSHIPYFLTDDDYQRMDSLLSVDGYVASQLEADRDALMSFTGSMMAGDITRDPLNLFSQLSTLNSPLSTLNSQFTLYDGYIFTSDMQRAIVTLDSPFGSGETENNARLLDLLTTTADSTLNSPLGQRPLATNGTQELSTVTCHFTGGPVIAVGNARQIKSDSLLSISIAVVLILLLLWFSIRNLRNILLIAISIAWGWLFALAALSLIHSEVSLIVIGISSVIVGIAVNYPLHLISHLSHTPDVRQALREISKPLVVGNITTVGAFLALVPLQSVALRDLGLFSSFLLIGTILFTLLWLPHFVKQTANHSASTEGLAGKSSINYQLQTINKNTWLLTALALLTIVFGYFSLRISFDADMNHINYMTAEQKADMAEFSGMGQTTDDPHFLLSADEQARRLSLWKDWTSRHRDHLTEILPQEAARAGFAEGSFDEFLAILSANYEPQPLEHFRMLPPSLLAQNIDMKGLNSTLVNSLSDDFNYIGWACASIVFIFLWVSFRSLPLAMLSFLPMALSWLWILGIMVLLGIQFNIVNIILATFIFGQGDDYTIFMTEGTVYEYTHRRPMLASYRRAILLSALIMFIGIGSLIVARHPALHSLAEVTIVGMFSVVLMAFVIPPIMFRWLVRYRKIFKRKK